MTPFRCVQDAEDRLVEMVRLPFGYRIEASESPEHRSRLQLGRLKVGMPLKCSNFCGRIRRIILPYHDTSWSKVVITWNRDPAHATPMVVSGAVITGNTSWIELIGILYAQRGCNVHHHSQGIKVAWFCQVLCQGLLLYAFVCWRNTWNDMCARTMHETFRSWDSYQHC